MLLPASTWDAANETLVVVVAVEEASSSVVVSVDPSAHTGEPLAPVVGVVPSEQVSVVPVVAVASVLEVSVELVRVPNDSVITPSDNAANWVKPAEPVDGVPLIS